jgi:hypothetical protein
LIRKPLPIFEGDGQLRFPGHESAVSYRIEGDPGGLKSGTARLRGSIRSEPAVVEEAFRAGDGVLVLEAGRELRLVMLGHTAGDDRVFVELRV